MYRGSLDLGQLLILAAYVLFQTKEHVDGCGGESHIAVLRNAGNSGKVEESLISEITKLLESADGEMGRILLASANLSLGKKEFYRESRHALDVVDIFRDIARDHLSNLRQAMVAPGSPMAGLLPIQTDDLGIVKRSTSRKSKRAQ
jgi:hypothetical protein